VMGSALSSAYLSHLDLSGLPPAIAKVVQQGLFEGLAVAGKMGSAALLDSVRSAFVYGMDVSLVVAAGIAGVGMLLALAFLPSRTRAKPREAAVASLEEPLVITG
jgi:MFS transporter, DHA2 family, multidrug resistance protein